MRTARAAVFTGPRAFELRELPLPHIAADEALLRVEACGLCGSDLDFWEGSYAIPFAYIPGHEPVGIIEEIGPAASKRWGVQVGDRVAVEPASPCGTCPRCLSGHYLQCKGITGMHGARDIAKGSGLYGGYATHMHLGPRTLVHPIDKELPLDLASLFNALGAGFDWVCDAGGTQVGDTVLVLGAGQRGLSSVVAARVAGAATVIVTDLATAQHKLDLARELGADHTITASEDVVATVKELTGGELADVVVDTVGHDPQTAVDAVHCVRAGGTVVLAGIKGKPVPEFSTDFLLGRSITLRGVLGVHGRSFRRAISVLESRRFPLEKMHTHAFGLDQADVALQTLAEGSDAIHVSLRP
jgi:threonine dehydrogenase-like Zn-dependent dehydrogenase